MYFCCVYYCVQRNKVVNSESAVCTCLTPNQTQIPALTLMLCYSKVSVLHCASHCLTLHSSVLSTQKSYIVMQSVATKTFKLVAQQQQCVGVGTTLLPVSWFRV